MESADSHLPHPVVFLGGNFFALFWPEKYDFGTYKGFLWKKNGATELDFEIQLN